MNEEQIRTTELPFSLALNAMRYRKIKITGAGWNGKGQFLEIQMPDENSKMTLPYIYITTVDGNRVP